MIDDSNRRALALKEQYGDFYIPGFHVHPGFLFGTDFPTCNPAMFLGGVILDTLITEEEKKMILAENAKRRKAP